MEVLFHIGAPKAGSTAIQEMLQLNAEPLAAQDILAWSPAQTVKDQARLLADRFLPPNRPLLPIERVHFRNRAETITRSHDAWTDIAAQVKRLRPRLTILSSEAMMAVSHPSHVIAALSEIFERITILVYIRDPVEQYRSGIDQVIRGEAGCATCRFLRISRIRTFPYCSGIRPFLARIGLFCATSSAATWPGATCWRIFPAASPG
ncbi:hypothetical protein [Gemmobacter sp.]|uniref:hypothetical protein n=1 Tax=Gemmobacter sp. TaxID=1898957 RepID=UPI002AFED003|nr:hypothetical protein [Gemmobacter sp.]